METTVRNRRVAIDDNCQETLLGSSQKEEIVSQENGHQTSQHHFENSTVHTPNGSLPMKFRAMRITLYILHKALNVIYVPLFIYRAFEKSRKCTRVRDELLMIPVTKLTKKIRRKEIACETVIRSYITRIKEVNPLLNAVIDDRFSEAIEEAKKIDQLVASEDFLKNEESIVQQYPLLGIPLTVKGSIAVKGLMYTSGMATRKNVIAENDAAAVDLARKAGAIPLLVSNVPELCMNWETFNKLIGTTKNPYDSTRTCGGSSGGEASLIGSGGSLIGIGSDIAGSLRIPAHNCGVWGHKPTPGVVSFQGHYPSCSNHDDWRAVFTLGPMARYAGDLKILLGVISVPEKRTRLGLSDKVNIKKVKVHFTEMENYFWNTPNEPCAGAVRKVVAYFKTICESPPEKVNSQLFEYATDLASLRLIDLDNVDYICDTNGNGPYSELLRYTTFRSKYSFSTISYGLIKKLNGRISENYKQKLRKSLVLLRQEFENTLGRDGVLIMPTFPVEAIKHGDWLRFALGSGYNSIFNVLGFPVTNCPVGVTEAGLPIGIQVVGLPYSDKLTLSVAEEIEEAFGGWRSPDSQ